VTLVETMAAITVTSVVVGAGVVLLSQMLRGEARTRDHVRRLVEMGLLSARFREETPEAVRVLLGGEGAREIIPHQGSGAIVLVLVLRAGERVEYVARPDGLYRVVRAMGGVRRERYSLPAGWSCSVRVDEQHGRRWLVLTLRVASAGGEGRACSIEAPLTCAPEPHDEEGE
jgi:type II secretory pathway component PulJ